MIKRDAKGNLQIEAEWNFNPTLEKEFKIETVTLDLSKVKNDKVVFNQDEKTLTIKED